MNKKLHLVDWILVCQSKTNGDLGVRPLEIVNQVLLEKTRRGRR